MNWEYDRTHAYIHTQPGWIVISPAVWNTALVIVVSQTVSLTALWSFFWQRWSRGQRAFQFGPQRFGADFQILSLHHHGTPYGTILGVYLMGLCFLLSQLGCNLEGALSESVWRAGKSRPTGSLICMQLKMLTDDSIKLFLECFFIWDELLLKQNSCALNRHGFAEWWWSGYV